MTGTPTRFGARLAEAVSRHGPLCVGIDPHAELLADWGLADDPAGVERFARSVIAALAEEIALVKPQSAFFERHGSAGIAVLERVLADARDAGLLALLDAKRGDIGSTMAGYVDAYLTDGSPLAADALTVSPYLGFGALRDVVTAASTSGRGLFVLARTSNPDSAEVQLAERDGRSVAQRIVDAASAHNAGCRPMGDIGVVVGATHRHGLALDELNGPVLAPGLGAQGATPADLAERFSEVTGVVLPSVSRSLLRAGPSDVALRDAARRWRAELAAAGRG